MHRDRESTITVDFSTRLTPRARRVLESVPAVAQEAGAQDFIGVEHIFLAIIDDEESLPSQVLRGLGVTDRVRGELERILNSEGYRTARTQKSNAVVRGGKVVGYAVVGADGNLIVVDESGTPVREVPRSPPFAQ